MKSEDFFEAVSDTLLERESVHGDAAGTFERIASLWSVELGTPVTLAQVARMMILFKVARAGRGEFNPDDYIDAAGYAALASRLHQEAEPDGGNRPCLEKEPINETPIRPWMLWRPEK